MANLLARTVQATLASTARRMYSSSSSTFSNILVEKRGGSNEVGYIQLNRPKALNSLCDELMNELGTALKQFDSDPTIKSIVLTGCGKAFAAGADIKEMLPKDYPSAYGENFIENWTSITKIRKPIIAAVNGFALGGGCELAMMCDIIYAAENAKFGQPEIRLGTIPGAGGTQRLPKAVGKSKAMELCLTGDMISAKEAESAGLVSRVIPNDKLQEAAIDLGERIGKQSLMAIYAAKECINQAYETQLGQGLLFERRVFQASFSTYDRREGMGAFVEKRPAEFKDK